MSVTTQQFKDAILLKLTSATSEGRDSITIHAGKLHEELGNYPGRNHTMPCCCNAMLALMTVRDRIITQPPKGKGANLEIKYLLPREL